MTGLYPYAGVTLVEWLSAWAAAGYGLGEVTVKKRDGAAFKADLSLAMGAAGLRSEVARPPADGGLFLAVKSDARFTHTSSGATRSSAGNLAASEADTWLARAGVEGAWHFAHSDVSLTPLLEVGARLDGGDAGTGFGMDLGGGIAYADPKSGLGLDLEAHGLVAHEAGDFRRWGASILVAFDPRPGTDHGLSLSLRQSVGASPASGVDALQTLAGLAESDLGLGAEARANAGLQASSRLEGEISYGLIELGGGFVGTPSLGFGLSDGGVVRDWRVGWRLTSAQLVGDSGFEVNIDATRREVAGSNGPPAYGATLRAAHRW